MKISPHSVRPTADLSPSYGDGDGDVEGLETISRGLAPEALRVALVVEPLRGIAFPPEQADPNHWEMEITDRLHVVAGENPETTGIDGKL